MSAHAIAAQILETSAHGFAREAAIRLQTAFAGAHAELTDSASDWQAHLYQRIIELAAAVRVDEPQLFYEKMLWLRQAYAARGVSEDVPKAVLDALRQTIREDLPAEPAALALQVLEAALSALESPDSPAETELDPKSPEGALALRFIAACMDGMPDEAAAMILDAIGEKLSPQAAITDVLMPAEREIGNLWHRNDASIAQEHVQTNTTVELLAVIGRTFAPEHRSDRTVIAASVSGNAHDMGIRAAAVLLRLAGWRTVFLGTDLPPREIAASADHFGAHVAILSATIGTQVDALAEAVECLRKSQSSPAIVVGGGVFESAPELWQRIGADAHCSQIGATVRIADALLERKLGQRV
ncbi:MAG TPA: cobalamin-dependent protein [Gammaproteobacteria bacterium]|nr:cobalamin-dependent protein [Gammaproteobacteria bacterium]